MHPRFHLLSLPSTWRTFFHISCGSVLVIFSISVFEEVYFTFIFYWCLHGISLSILLFSLLHIVFFKDSYLIVFRGSRREGKRDGEKHQCVVASHVPLTGDLACNPGMCRRLGIELATLGFAGWCSTTEPHQPEAEILMNHINIQCW